MPVVTDKEYYLDENLKANLDFCIKRQEKKFDHLFIIDGDEGYGKTNLAIGMGTYLSWATQQEMKIFFDVERLLDYAATNTKKVIIWDEAALIGLSKEWRNRIQIKLTKFLMVARKKGHFYIFNLPHIVELNKYLAVYRSIALLHTYSSDNLHRGEFVFLSKRLKNRAWFEMKKNNMQFYKKFDFHGKFVIAEHLIDMEQYDKEKDEAIISITEDEQPTGQKLKIIYLQHYISRLDRYSYDELAEIFGVHRQALYNWAKLDKKHPQIVEERGFYRKSRTNT